MTTPLITWEQYQTATGDKTTSKADVEAALTEAIAVAEAITNRGLTKTERTETLPVHRNGRVYPTATPIDSVSVPDGATIHGSALAGGFAGSAWTSGTSTADVTYVGGFTNETLPVRLRRAICAVAYRVAHPDTTLGQVPAGAKSVSVGDVSIGGDGLALLDVIDAGAARDLARYKRRTITPAATR